MKSFVLSTIALALFLATSVHSAPVEHSLSPSQTEAASASPAVMAPDIFLWDRRSSPSPTGTTDAPGASHPAPLAAPGIFLWRRGTADPTQTTDSPTESSSSPILAPDIFLW
ncbi:hypothetical protein EVJ58_g301 [Rhodofomes roseus]|uniref:Uncharacterized protein n=1 Tax=Rhodofomes roseus TaxID=34475 RepID=A0A4Y9Z6I3_9APHY|nr:hypothetical protein EVJ58_g301 [Rhodofomes roseus]